MDKAVRFHFTICVKFVAVTWLMDILDNTGDSHRYAEMRFRIVPEVGLYSAPQGILYYF